MTKLQRHWLIDRLCRSRSRSHSVLHHCRIAVAIVNNALVCGFARVRVCVCVAFVGNYAEKTDVQPDFGVKVQMPNNKLLYNVEECRQACKQVRGRTHETGAYCMCHALSVGIRSCTDKQFSYRRGTARCVS